MKASARGLLDQVLLITLFMLFSIATQAAGFREDRLSAWRTDG
jgi:hypothetical protein